MDKYCCNSYKNFKNMKLKKPLLGIILSYFNENKKLKIIINMVK